MVSLQNEFSYESSVFQLQNKNKNNIYTQRISPQYEFLCEFLIDWNPDNFCYTVHNDIWVQQHHPFLNVI